jgi:methanogenic corrinoid protein MtbC1
VNPSAGERIRIGELSRRTGVSVALLRAWEQRYGVTDPIRTPGGFRTYGAEDERRVRAMRAGIEGGLSASRAAAAVVSGAGFVAPGASSTLRPADIRAALADAIDRFDERGANAALDRLLAGFSLETALDEGFLPYLQSLGARWEAGEVTIAQEHFATSIIRGRLLALARNWGDGAGPLALLACPTGEQHDLGLICFGLGLRARGWRIALLGPNTPIDTLAEAADRLDPALVAIASMQGTLLEEVEGEISGLAERHRVALAGPGAAGARLRQTRAWLVDGPPMEAAARVAAAISP